MTFLTQERQRKILSILNLKGKNSHFEMNPDAENQRRKKFNIAYTGFITHSGEPKKHGKLKRKILIIKFQRIFKSKVQNILETWESD